MTEVRYVGVHITGSKWMARIKLRSKYYYLGSFETPLLAAQERDK